MVSEESREVNIGGVILNGLLNKWLQRENTRLNIASNIVTLGNNPSAAEPLEGYVDEFKTAYKQAIVDFEQGNSSVMRDLYLQAVRAICINKRRIPEVSLDHLSDEDIALFFDTIETLQDGSNQNLKEEVFIWLTDGEISEWKSTLIRLGILENDQEVAK